MIAVISDIHSNFEALKAVLTDIDSRNISEVFCLGDLIGYGPEPEEVVTEIRLRNIPTVIGNHEAQLVGLINDMNDDSLIALSINEELLSVESKDYISELPLNISINNLLFVHGCPPDSFEKYLRPKWTSDEEWTREKKFKLFNSFNEKVAFVGHTHIGGIFELGSFHIRYSGETAKKALNFSRRYIINCGSIGQQRVGVDNNARYVIYDPQSMTIHFIQVKYDVSKTLEKMRVRGIPDGFIGGLQKGTYWDE